MLPARSVSYTHLICLQYPCISFLGYGTFANRPAGSSQSKLGRIFYCGIRNAKGAPGLRLQFFQVQYRNKGEESICAYTLFFYYILSILSLNIILFTDFMMSCHVCKRKSLIASCNVARNLQILVFDNMPYGIVVRIIYLCLLYTSSLPSFQNDDFRCQHPDSG